MDIGKTQIQLLVQEFLAEKHKVDKSTIVQHTQPNIWIKK